MVWLLDYVYGDDDIANEIDNNNELIYEVPLNCMTAGKYYRYMCDKTGKPIREVYRCHAAGRQITMKRYERFERHFKDIEWEGW